MAVGTRGSPSQTTTGFIFGSERREDKC